MSTYTIFFSASFASATFLAAFSAFAFLNVPPKRYEDKCVRLSLIRRSAAGKDTYSLGSAGLIIRFTAARLCCPQGQHSLPDVFVDSERSTYQTFWSSLLFPCLTIRVLKGKGWERSGGRNEIFAKSEFA